MAEVILLPNTSCYLFAGEGVMGQAHGARKCDHILAFRRHPPNSFSKELLCPGTITRSLNKTCMSSARNLENSLITFSPLVFQQEVEDSEDPGQELISHKVEGAWVP